ncbi:MAG: hypothetical protein Q4D21_07660 [Phascolarctobacterium sp.]|nr:hypothetical protein [Phascolarctobacterium sp.]
MIIREAIMSSARGSRVHKRIFDIVVEDGCMSLEIKNGKTITSVPWDDVICQVEAIRRRTLI